MSNPLGFKQYLLSLLILGSITLLQAMSGTRFVYSACYKLMEQHDGISRVQLNNLIVASEIGRLFGYFPIVAAEYLPEWMILIIGLIFGSVGYGMQYLSITNVHPFLSYWQILLFSVLAGNSICWISTYCDLVAIRNFKNSHETVTEMTSSYCGLTGKIYTSLAEGIRGRNVVSQDSSLYLLLSCLAPTVVGLAMAFLNCLVQVVEYEETKLFPSVFMIVIATGVYAGVESIAQPFMQMSPQLRVVILLLFVMLPLLVALLMAAKQLALAKWDSQEVPAEVTDTVVSESKPKRPATNEGLNITIEDHKREGLQKAEQNAEKVTDRQVAENNNENGLKELLTNEDFWLFYCMNMCGATLGMVYLNNLEIISKSHGYHKASLLLATSSTFNFFGRTFSVIFTWYTRETSTISKPALTMLLMIPMPLAFFLLISSNNICLYISTCIIGTGSGAINAIIATSTSEFLGSANSLVKQTIIVPTNVPLGILLFGYLAASNYDSEGSEDRNICMGLKCHHLTFTIWGSFSSIGTLLSFSLYLRKRKGHSWRS